MDKPILVKLCLNCKNPIIPRKHPGGSPKVYCSNACRWHAANIRHPRHPKKKQHRFLWFANGICIGLIFSVLILLAYNPKPEIIMQSASCPISTPYPSQTIYPTQTALSCPVQLEYARRISDKGIEFIKQWESFRAAMYLAPEGGCTVGYGHLINSGPCTSSSWPSYVSLKGANILLIDDIRKVEFEFFRNVELELSQNRYDALISIGFNMGWNSFSEKEFITLLETGQFDKIPDSIRWYTGDINGDYQPGLDRRRQAEARLFEFGIY